MTKVSVVVPAYNVESFLPRCIDSLITQTETSIEIIVVDDGSTDSTGQVADRYAAQDSRVRVVHRFNGGLSAARNSGLDIAIGELVAFVDGDDWVDVKMLEGMAARLESTDADVVIAGMHIDQHDARERLLNSHDQRAPELVIDADNPLPGLFVDGSFVNLLGYAWNKIYRRELIASNGLRFVDGLSLVEDITFNAEALSKADRIALLDEAFVHYIQRPRVTLGTKTYQDLLDLRLRAVRAVEQILTHFGVPEEQRDYTASHMSLTALVMAVRTAAQQAGNGAHRADVLRNILSVDGTTFLLALARRHPGPRRRDRFTLTLLHRGQLRTVLLPMRAVVTVQAIRGACFIRRS